MPNAVTKVYDYIRSSVMSGELAAGARVKEELIAEQVGVSRTPIREALHKLTAEGFLTMPPNQGARVIEWTGQDLIEIIDLRAALESLGAERASQLITAEQLTQLEELASKMEQAAAQGDTPSLAAITDLNSHFHKIIVDASGNARLADVIDTLAHPLLVQRQFIGFDHKRLQRSMAHHLEIIDALRARDGRWAASIMRAHILASQVNLSAR